MRISRAKARNIKGFVDFDQQFGDVNVISGRNAAGKSTVLDILCAAFITDGDRDLLRVGADSGEILVVLEEGGETIEVRRTLRHGSISSPKLRASNGDPGPAAAFIKSVVDCVTIDPIRQVMVAPPKEQVRILLETMPLEMDAEPVVKAVGGLLPGLRLANGKANLETIRGAHDSLYKERTDVNRDLKQRTAAAAQLRDSVKGWTAPEGRSWTDVFNDIDRQLQALVAEDAAKREQAERGHGRAVADRKLAVSVALAQVDDDIDARIRQLEEERAERKSVISDEAYRDLEQIAADHRLTMDAIAGGSQEERDRLTAEKAKAQQLSQSEAQVARTMEIARETEIEGELLRSKSEVLTSAIEALRNCQKTLLESLPIQGLEVSNGSATYNGIPLGELNTAEKAKFWIRVAVLRAVERRLQAVVLDGIECMDDLNYPRLLQACKDSGLQFFIARVEPHDLKIEVI
jgi:DNA repair exonuclease SbcCD ATPase subunit